MSCGYTYQGWRCDNGRLAAPFAALEDETVHACPKCNGLLFLQIAKEVAEKPAKLRVGCPCCSPGGSGLDYWLSAVETVNACNAKELDRILSFVGSVNPVNEKGTRILLCYNEEILQRRGKSTIRCEKV